MCDCFGFGFGLLAFLESSHSSTNRETRISFCTYPSLLARLQSANRWKTI